MCWYCHWGLPEPVANIYSQALNGLGGDDERPLLYGPAHIVWHDYNLDTDSIDWCLANFEKYSSRFNASDMLVVKRSLEQLLEIPENERHLAPNDLDGDYASVPPPVDVVMVKVRD